MSREWRYHLHSESIQECLLEVSDRLLSKRGDCQRCWTVYSSRKSGKHTALMTLVQTINIVSSGGQHRRLDQHNLHIVKAKVFLWQRIFHKGRPCGRQRESLPFSSLGSVAQVVNSFLKFCFLVSTHGKCLKAHQLRVSVVKKYKLKLYSHVCCFSPKELFLAAGMQCIK